MAENKNINNTKDNNATNSTTTPITSNLNSSTNTKTKSPSNRKAKTGTGTKTRMGTKTRKNSKSNIKSRKRKTQKPKEYIPAYKIIIFCTAIITICMVLLLATSLMSKQKQPSISTRYEESITKEDKKADKPKAGQEAVGVNNNKNEKPVTVEEKNKEQQQIGNENKKSTEQTSKESKTETQKKDENEIKAKKQEQKKDSAKVVIQEKKEFGFPKAVNNDQLIFVFDDGGHSLTQAEKFLELPFPFTMAILPRLKFSKETADLIRKSGNEVILHQPMQAINLSVDPGPGAIKPDMNESQIISTLFQNITEIGPVAGMNNHEGSAITADAEKMAIVLRFTSQEGIYFLDSRTNVDTTVPYVAKELGYSYYERNIFLDNEKTRDNILSELNKAISIANKKGNVIMIGHVWSADILPDILMEVYPELKEKGYTFSVVSKSNAKK